MSIERKRFQDKILESEYRFYNLKVRLNFEELEILDIIKSRYSRAEAVRYLIMSNIPSTVPSINQAAWVELSKSASNLNQIAYKLNSGDAPEIAEIRQTLETFRASLLGVKNE